MSSTKAEAEARNRRRRERYAEKMRERRVAMQLTLDGRRVPHDQVVAEMAEG